MPQDISSMTPVKLYLAADNASVYDDDGYFVGLLNGSYEVLDKAPPREALPDLKVWRLRRKIKEIQEFLEDF